MNTQKIKAGDGNVKDAVMDIEGIANIDIGATEVDVSEIIIKGMPKGKKKYCWVTRYESSSVTLP